MPIKQIVTDPTKLNKPCNKAILPALIDQVCIDLMDTAKAHQKTCVGLAANQIGHNLCIIVVRSKTGFVLMINPVIEPEKIKGKLTKREGCLSFPGITKRIKRYKKIKVTYTPWIDGAEEITETYVGLVARIIQHEAGHLKGELI